MKNTESELERDAQFFCVITLLLISLSYFLIEMFRFVIAIGREVFDSHELYRSIPFAGYSGVLTLKK
jgi:hypothetical protein